MWHSSTRILNNSSDKIFVQKSLKKAQQKQIYEEPNFELECELIDPWDYLQHEPDDAIVAKVFNMIVCFSFSTCTSMFLYLILNSVAGYQFPLYRIPDQCAFQETLAAILRQGGIMPHILNFIFCGTGSTSKTS